MPNLDEIFTTNTVLNYVKNRTPQALLGDALFPERKIQDLTFEMIKGANNVPVSASIHAFDTETQIASRDGFNKSIEELALVKRKIRMGEKTLIMINTPRNDAEKELATNLIYDDIDNMVNGVKTRVEAMRFEAISTGKIVVDENGVKATIDYGTPATHQETLSGTSLWTDTASSPLDNIYDWVDKIVTDTGITPTRALTTKSVLGTLLKNTSIRKSLFGTNSDRIATLEMLNQLLVSMDLPQIATYNSQYRVQNADGTYTNKKYLADGKFIILPDGNLGETVYGLTAEEIELSGKSDVNIQSVGNIIAEIYSTTDPVAKWTKAVATVLPSFPVADQVFQATVK